MKKLFAILTVCLMFAFVFATVGMAKHFDKASPKLAKRFDKASPKSAGHADFVKDTGAPGLSSMEKISIDGEEGLLESGGWMKIMSMEKISVEEASDVGWITSEEGILARGRAISTNAPGHADFVKDAHGPGLQMKWEKPE